MKTSVACGTALPKPYLGKLWIFTLISLRWRTRSFLFILPYFEALSDPLKGLHTSAFGLVTSELSFPGFAFCLGCSLLEEKTFFLLLIGYTQIPLWVMKIVNTVSQVLLVMCVWELNGELLMSVYEWQEMMSHLLLLLFLCFVIHWVVLTLHTRGISDL